MCAQRDRAQLGITFDDDLDNYTIRAVSTILEGTPARMMGFEVLEQSDDSDANVGNSDDENKSDDVLSLGEEETHQPPESLTNDSEKCVESEDKNL